jgi:hypothetical protein
MKSIARLSLLLGATAAQAHQGHGLADPHWHSTDVVGFVVLAVAIALAVWASRRK